MKKQFAPPKPRPVEFLTVDEYRARRFMAKTKTAFDGHSIIRNRLERLKISFEEEFHFCLPRKFRADFLLSHYKILLEYQGQTYAGKGGHNSGGGIDRDGEKLNLAMIHGYRLFQFTSNMLRGHGGFSATYFEETILAATGVTSAGKNWIHRDGREGGR